MRTAEEKAVTKRYFLHKDGSLVSGDDLARAVYFMVGDERLKEADPRMDTFIHMFFKNIERELEPDEITVSNFLKLHERTKAIRLYYDLQNSESYRCSLVQAKDYIDNLEMQMKECGQL